MQGMKYAVRFTRSRLLIKIIIGIIAACILVFFLFRFVPLSQNDEDAELLRLVTEDKPLDEGYSPKLSQVEGIDVSEDCAEALQQMLQAAREAGCEPQLIEGFLDRKSQQEQYDELIKALVSQGNSPEEAERLALKTTSLPGANEHQLGLTVDIVDMVYSQRNMDLLESDTYKWLSENCWEYGFVIRYPENKSDVTGRDFMPWHYRYVGLESAQLIKELGLSLEEFYTWFYSDDVIVIMD